MTGTTTNVMFTIDRPAKAVWPYLRDFNLWQNSYHHYYSGVAGDLEGRTIRLVIGSDLNAPERLSAEYRVVRVIPEHLLMISQVVVEDGPVAGMGGLTVFMLNEHDEKTVITILMQHDRLTQALTEEEALAPWRASAPENLMKWRDFFIPTLKRLATRLYD